MKRRLFIAGAAFFLFAAMLTGGHFLSVAHPAAEKARETTATPPQWEYLVVAGGQVNLSSSGVNSRMSKQPAESGFTRENYPLERNLARKVGNWSLCSPSIRSRFITSSDPRAANKYRQSDGLNSRFSKRG